MTTQSVAAPDAATTGTAPATRTRTGIVAAGLALSSVVVGGILLWHPGPARNSFEYADLAADRDALWAARLIESVGWAVAAVTLAVAVCLLARERGARFATVGGILLALGGVFTAGTSAAYGQIAWYATAPEASGTELVAYMGDNFGHLAVGDVAGFLLFNVGTLLAGVALWRARSVPRWLPIALAVLVLAQFAGGPDRLLDCIQAAIMACFVVVAGYLARSLRP